MTKSELIAELSRRSALSKAEAGAMLAHLASIAADQLSADGGSLQLPGIVKLERKHRAARVGRNPRTGMPVDVPAKTVISAKPIGALKDVAA